MAFFIDQKSSFEKVITPEEINFFIDFYYSFTGHIVKNGMRKINVDQYSPEVLDKIHSIIARLGFENYKLLGDNFYEHMYSYFPHCDAKKENSWVNIVVPLKVFNPRGQQKFIVFDQKYPEGSATWIGTFDMQHDFLYNKKLNERICDFEGVEGLTGRPLDPSIYDNMWQKYLPIDYLFGMSGTVFDWTPGNAIVFDSRFIHSTGKMMCDKKLGLSIRLGVNQ